MRNWRLTLAVAIPLAVAAVISALIGYSVSRGQPVGAALEESIRIGMVWKVLLLTLFLAGWVVLVARMSVGRYGLDEARRAVLIGVGLGYLLNPLSWTGRGYFAQWWWTDNPGVHTFVIDAVAWLAIGVAVTLLVTGRSADVARPAW